MERALNVREIMEMVIEHADRKSIVACARVCKFWSDVALDDIWFTLQEPGHLFVLLNRGRHTSTNYGEVRGILLCRGSRNTERHGLVV